MKLALNPEAGPQALTSNLYTAAGTLLGRQRELGVISLIGRGGPLAPAPAQERLWQLSRGALDSPYYNVALTWDVRGPVDIQALEHALDTMVQRHEILRSSFREVAGQPSIVIQEVRLSLEVFPVEAGCSATGRAGALQKARAELQKPLNLEKDLPLKAVLYRYSEADSLLLLKVHQIAFDGNSLLVFARELKAIYTARLDGRDAVLPGLPIQYYDFAAWHRHLLAGRLLADEEAFWIRQFEKPYAPMPLAESRADSCAAPGPVTRSSFLIPESVAIQLTELAGEAQTTLFYVLLAAFHSYLHIRTGHDDIVVFTTAAGRPRPELQRLVGFVANVLPFRVEFNGDASFREIVARVGLLASAVLPNQLLPLDNILKNIQITGSRIASGCFQAALTYLDSKLLGFSVGATTFTPAYDLDNESGRFSIQLDLRRTPHGIEGWAKCRPDFLGPEWAGHFAGEFSRCLENWAGRPESPLSERGRACGHQQTLTTPTQSGPLDHLPCDQAEAVVGQRSQPSSKCKVSPEFVHETDGPQEGEAYYRDVLQRQLIVIWEKTLRTAPIGLQDNFFRLGGDSLSAVQLKVQVEELTGKHLPLATLFEAPTVAAMTQKLLDERPHPRCKALVPIKVAGSRPPIYFVHGWGGNVLEFYGLAHHLAHDQPVYALQSVGLDGKEEPFSRIEDMAAHYLREIREIQPQGPFALCGQSFGGMVVFEMAQQLVAKEQRPPLLVLLDTHPPAEWISIRQRFEKAFLFQVRRTLYHLRRLSQVRWSDRLNYLRTMLHNQRVKFRSTLSQRDYHRRSQQSEKLSRPFVRVRESNHAALLAYRYRPYPGEMIWFQAVEEGLGALRDPESAWRRLVSTGLRVYRTPGDHISLIKEPHVATLARQLQGCLDQWQDRVCPPAASESPSPGAQPNDPGNGFAS